jgi:hypothetical protein
MYLDRQAPASRAMPPHLSEVCASTKAPSAGKRGALSVQSEPLETKGEVLDSSAHNPPSQRQVPTRASPISQSATPHIGGRVGGKALAAAVFPAV